MPLVGALLPSVWCLLWGCNLLISIHVNHVVHGFKRHSAHTHTKIKKKNTKTTGLSECGNHISSSSEIWGKKSAHIVGVWLRLLWNGAMKTKPWGHYYCSDVPSMQSGWGVCFSELKRCVQCADTRHRTILVLGPLSWLLHCCRTQHLLPARRRVLSAFHPWVRCQQNAMTYLSVHTIYAPQKYFWLSFVRLRCKFAKYSVKFWIFLLNSPGEQNGISASLW